MNTKVKIGLAVLVVGIVVATLAQNAQPVQFKFWPLLEVQVSKTALIVISAALGSLATIGAQWYLQRRKQSSEAAKLSPGSTSAP